ncbi:MAG: hypothetical protein FJ243_00660 [Nitrospira sp.]|nr:hypothetical protein [Nitrospira sp.]
MLPKFVEEAVFVDRAYPLWYSFSESQATKAVRGSADPESFRGFFIAARKERTDEVSGYRFKG